MRIHDEDNDLSICAVTLFLTRAEAEELRDSVQALLSGDPSDHQHVPSPDFQKEVTV